MKMETTPMDFIYFFGEIFCNSIMMMSDSLLRLETMNTVDILGIT